jgi:putative phage-type endonuclease
MDKLKLKATKLTTYPAGSPEWINRRLNSVGGSEIGTIMGQNQYETREQLLERKLGTLDAIEQTDAMRWGQLTEPALIQLYSEKYPDVETFGNAGTYCHHVFSRFHANLDGFYIDGDELGILELKTRAYPFKGGQPPSSYKWQVSWYMHVLGLQNARLVAFVAGKLEVYNYTYNAFEGEIMQTEALSFLNDLDGKK